MACPGAAVAAARAVLAAVGVVAGAGVWPEGWGPAVGAVAAVEAVGGRVGQLGAGVREAVRECMRMSLGVGEPGWLVVHSWAHSSTGGSDALLFVRKQCMCCCMCCRKQSSSCHQEAVCIVCSLAIFEEAECVCTVAACGDRTGVRTLRCIQLNTTATSKTAPTRLLPGSPVRPGD